MNIVKICCALALLCLLSGCFSIGEEIWVNPDGSGRVKIDFGMSEQLLSMGGSMNKDQMRSRQGALKQKYESNPLVRKAEFSDYSEGGLYHMVWDLEVTDASRIAEVLDEKSLNESFGGEQRTSTPTEGGPPKELSNFMIPKVEKLSNGNYNFVSVFDKPASPAPSGTPDPNNPFNEEFSRKMLEPMFADKFYALTLHAPNIVSTNGELEPSGRTVRWKIPMIEFMSDKAVRKEMQAEIGVPTGLRKYGRWLIIGGIGLAVVAVIGAITLFLVFKKRNTA